MPQPLQSDAARLVETLRASGSLDEMKDAAYALAQSGDVNNYLELYRMAEGKHRSGLSWYRVPHMLIAMEALAKSGTEEATKFLDDLLQYKVESFKPPTLATSRLFKYYCEFPNIPRRLRRHVCIATQKEFPKYGDFEDFGDVSMKVWHVRWRVDEALKARKSQ